MSTPQADAFRARIQHRVRLDADVVERALSQQDVVLAPTAQDRSVTLVHRYLIREGYRGIHRVEVGAALEAAARAEKPAERTPGADVMVEAAAQAMFEDPDTPGDYTWAEMVAEDRTRADLWRQSARRVLVAAGALHPRVLSAPAPQAPSVEDVRTVIESAVWAWFNAKGAPWSPGDATVAAFTGPLEEKIRALYAPVTAEEAIRESVLAADRIPVVGLRVDAPSTDVKEVFLADSRKAPKNRPDSCPACRHQNHDGRRGCLNAASDNDCACTHGAPKPPSDEQVLAALNAQVRKDRRAPDLSYWGDAAVDSMRAALAAAQIAPTEMRLPLTKLSSVRLREIIEACQEVVDARAADKGGQE